MSANDIILKLINSNATVNEICNITSLSPRQLFHRLNMLKMKGYDFRKKYYYDGEISYDLINSVQNEPKNETTIITSPEDNEFRAVLISDLHFGSIYESLYKLDAVYDFCIKNGFNIIFNIGDLIDGNTSSSPIFLKIKSISKQINHLLEKYPYDKNIVNFICLGNHDYDALSNEVIDLHKIFDLKRHDLVSLGYGYGFINIKNDKIALRHPINGVSREKLCEFSKGILLSGHSHKYKINVGFDYNVYVPTISDLKLNGENTLPSFLTLNVEFDKGCFKNANYEQYSFFGDKIYKMSEFKHGFEGKSIKDSEIKNEESRISLDEVIYNEIKQDYENYKNGLKILKKKK